MSVLLERSNQLIYNDGLYILTPWKTEGDSVYKRCLTLPPVAQKYLGQQKKRIMYI